MTILCQLKNLSLSFGNKVLFKEAGLTISEGDRVGLLGLNGNGKSSLFKVLNGSINPDASTPPFQFDRIKDFSVFLVPQELPLEKGDTVSIRNYLYRFYPKLEHMDAEEMERTEAWRIINDYESYVKYFGHNDLDKMVKDLSGGEQRKILLALGLSAQAKLILWDEPTNHLDIETIKLFEEELEQSGKTFLMISHDRYLLSRLTSRIFHVTRGRIEMFEGSYQNYLEFLGEMEEARKKMLDRLRNKLRRETAWMRQGIKARGTRSKKRVEGYHNLHKGIDTLKAEAHKSLDIRLIESKKQRKKLIEFKDVSFSFGAKTLFQNINFQIRRGDKIGILGPNGVGKTTMVRLIAGELEPTSGRVDKGDDLLVCHFSQKREALKEDMTPFQILGDGQDFIHLPDGRKMHVISYFKSFLFNEDELHRPLKTFSGGEKNRLQLALNLKSLGDVLIFDEPTNDLDLETLQLLEDRLSKFEGSLILISHDRAFLANVTDKILFLKDQSIETFEGGYEQAEPYIEALALEEELKAEAEKEKAQAAQAAQATPVTSGEKQKLSNKEKIRLKTIDAEISQKEEEIEKLGAEIEAFDFASADTKGHEHFALISGQKEKAEEDLLGLYEELEVLQSKS